jgi:tetratricopeptide (TPR) repeat protein
MQSAGLASSALDGRETPPARAGAPRRRSDDGTAGGGPSAPQNPFCLGPIAIDLGDILGDELTPSRGRPESSRRHDGSRPADEDAAGGPPADLEQVFHDAREEASRQAIGDGAERQYKVALAYQDVGMTAEAIKALELAVRAPRVRFEAASLLARLLLERGDRREAIEWFERAAEAPAPTLEASRALLYDLGGALESSGEHARALAVFLELQTEAGEYRDVARRLDRLRRDQAGG